MPKLFHLVVGETGAKSQPQNTKTLQIQLNEG